MICPLCQFDNPCSSKSCRACGTALVMAAGARSSDEMALPDALPNGTLLIGTYAVESVLGQGGFGITYRSHDQMLDRSVAIKEFFPSSCRRQNLAVEPARGLSDHDYRAARAQFLAEARILARCHHAGIVGVYAAFEANETAYMVMELLHGKTLAQLLSARGGRMEQAEAVGVIERVGEALGFVHDLDLLHRDIKPDNIIVCDDGRVMLIDFGTAREWVKGQAQGQTVVVTPGYAPLEQYAKQARRGAFTDVYGLAATLYHLLTGQMPPSASDRAMGVLLRPAREINPKISPNVARAVETGLQMEIARRPQSVREFLDLLHAPIEETPVAISPAPQSADWLPDDKETEPLFSSRRVDFAPDANDDENSQSIPATLTPDAIRARQQLWQNAVPTGNAQPVKLAPPRDFSAAPVAPTAATAPVAYDGTGGVRVQNANEPDNSSSFGWWMLGIIGFFVLLALFNSGGQQRTVTSSDFPRQSSSSNSNRSSTGGFTEPQDPAERALDALPVLVSASNQLLPGQEQTRSKNQYQPRDGVDFSPDGKRVAYIDSQSVLRVLRLPDRQILRSISLDKKIASINSTISLDNKTIAVAQDSEENRPVKDLTANQVSVWSLQTGKRLGQFKTSSTQDYVWPSVVLNDEQILLKVTEYASKKNKSFFWNPKTGKRTSPSISIAADATWFGSTLSPNGREFAEGDSGGRVHWLSFPDGKQKAERATRFTLREYRAQFQKNYVWGDSQKDQLDNPLGIWGLTYSNNGKYLASFSWGEINVFNARFNKIGSLILSANPKNSAVSPDGKWMALRGRLPNTSTDTPDANLLWNVKTGQTIQLPMPSNDCRGFSFSPDGKQLYGIFTGNGKFQLSTWQTDASPAKTFANPRKIVYQPGGTRMDIGIPLAQSRELSAFPVNSSIEIRKQDGSLFRVLNLGFPDVMALKFSAANRFLAVRRNDGAIQIWDVEASKIVAQRESKTFVATNGRISSPMAFSPDNKFFVCAYANDKSSQIELWNLGGEARLVNSSALKFRYDALAFSPDSKNVIYGNDKGLVQKLDVATFQPQTLVKGNEPVLDIINAAGNLVIVSVSQTTVYQLSVAHNSPVRQLAQIKQQLSPHSFGEQWAVSDDGQFMAFASYGEGIKVWRLPTGSFFQTVRQYVDENGMIHSSPSSCLKLMFSDDGTQLTSLERPFGGGSLDAVTWSRAK